MELGSNEAIKQAVIGGLGISVLSRHTLPMDVTTEQIALLDVQGFPIERHWCAVYPRGKQLSVVAHTFIDYLKEAHLHIDVVTYPGIRKKKEANKPGLSSGNAKNKVMADKVATSAARERGLADTIHKHRERT
jgi:hypothetical protein